METAVAVLIATGNLLRHLRGAWKCTCEIACIINTTVAIDVDPDPGF